MKKKKKKKMNMEKEKKKLARMILDVEDKKIISKIEQLLETEIIDREWSEGEKRELDAMRKEYKAGKGKNYSVAEVRQYVYSKLKK